MNWQLVFQQLLVATLYSVLGIVLFGVAFKIIQKFLPFSITKEIEGDQNTALAIIIGCIMLGLAIIVAAAIH